MRAIVLLIALTAPMLAGCIGSDDTVRIAFVGKDTALEAHEHPDRLADWITEQTGRPAKVFFFDSSTAALEAVRFGQADAASVDGAAAWLAWSKDGGMDVIASEVRGDGRTYYMAAAWVRADSDIQSVSDFAGRNSCHTGATKSAGMLMPMSYLVREGLINKNDYADDITQVQQMAHDFFGTATIGGAYEGYNGALQCLSEGIGEIAFIRDTTIDDYCTPGDAQAWCLDTSAYHKVIEFGQVPEHPFMVGPHVSGSLRADLLEALTAMDESQDGQGILADLFGTTELRAIPGGSQEHLGNFGSLVENLPGIQAYAEGK